MKKVEDTLAERGAVYGDYSDGLVDRATIMAVLKEAHIKAHGHEMPGIHQGMLWDIVNKLCRLAVTPDHVDSWHDIIGYATLAEQIVGEAHADRYRSRT